MNVKRRSDIIFDHANSMLQFVKKFRKDRSQMARDELIMSCDGLIAHCEQMKKEIVSEFEVMQELTREGL